MRTILLILVFACIYSTGNSQVKPTNKSVVMDEDGTTYPYLVWSTLVRNGDYTIHPLNKENNKTEFLLVKLTEKEKADLLERMPKPQESDYFRTGKELISFKTIDINNRKINLKEDKGKIIVINFWFINCPPCRMEIPSLNELVAIYKDNENIRFIGIALDSRYNLKEFLQTSPFNYDIIDSGYDIARKYNIRSFPTHVVIDQEGKVYFHTSGLAQNTVYWIKKSIEELSSRHAVVQQ